MGDSASQPNAQSLQNLTSITNILLHTIRYSISQPLTQGGCGVFIPSRKVQSNIGVVTGKSNDPLVLLQGYCKGIGYCTKPIAST